MGFILHGAADGGRRQTAGKDRAGNSQERRGKE